MSELLLISSLSRGLGELVAMTCDVSTLVTIDVRDDTFVVVWADPDRGVDVIEIEGECLTCALRETVLDLALRGCRSIVLPAGIELLHLCPGLAAAMAERGDRLARVVTVVDVDAARSDLLGDDTCVERGIALTEGDERTVADVLSLNMAYADQVVVIGDDRGGGELVDHLLAPTTLLSDLASFAPGGLHNPAAAIERVHPATCCASGGSSLHGTWTIDLYSDRPFHPERLRELVAEIGQDSLVVRGCFWIPSRPGRVCSFEAVGGAVSVGDCGLWETAPHCHVSVTGVGRPERGEKISRAFHEITCRDDESWSVADDLSDWLGAQA